MKNKRSIQMILVLVEVERSISNAMEEWKDSLCILGAASAVPYLQLRKKVMMWLS